MLVRAWVSVAFCPGYVSGLELNLDWGFAFDVAAQIEIGYGYDQVGAGVMVFGQDAARLQLELGDADAVLDEENVLVPPFRMCRPRSSLRPTWAEASGGLSRPARVRW